MDRRSAFARAAVQGLLSGLSLVPLSPLVACSTTPSPTTPSAPMEPTPTSTATSPSRVSPPPPPLRPGTMHSAPRAREERDVACCRGMNDCKGKGGCADAAHDCAGKNECKGKSTACAPGSTPVADPFASPKNCCKGKNECKGKSECKVSGQHACRGQNECKGKGWACLKP